MIDKGLRDDGLRPASSIDTDRPGRIPRDGIERSARSGPMMGRGRVAGAAEARAVRRLRRALGNAAMNPTPPNCIPAHLVALLVRMRRTDRALRVDLGRSPTFEEVAGALGLSDSQKVKVVRALRSLPMRPPVDGDVGEDEPILLMEVTDEPRAGDRRAR